MLFDLHGTKISLRSSDDRINLSWRHLFDYEIANHSIPNQQNKPDIVIVAEVTSSLPPAPTSQPVYCSSEPPLEVYTSQKQHLTLRLQNTSLIQLQFPSKASEKITEPAYANIAIAEPTFHTSSLENITMMALGPMLRRRSLFLIHAFTAALNKTAFMFAGPSGSGKTSSGLALAAAGWQVLANDMALLCQADAPLALLSPGSIQISPSTFTLLPQHVELMAKYPRAPQQLKASIPRQEFFDPDEIVFSASLKTVFFPTIGKTQHHCLKVVPRAIGLALLMESSMDQWDFETWNDHIRFLERLSHEVDFYELCLGHTMTDLADYLEKAMPL